MKNKLVGSPLGDLAIILRDWWALRSVSFSNPEQAGMIANDILAARLLTRLCPAGGGFLDVGAHIGSVFSQAARLGRDLHVYAVEADPEKSTALRRRFPGVTIFECAVGERDETAVFSRNLATPGYSSLNHLEGNAIERFEVRVRPLDDLLPDARIDVIKIDIEGAELGALRGGRTLIGREKPVIMFESVRLETNALGYSPEALWEFFEGEGYDVVAPNGLAHETGGMDLTTFLEAHVYPRRTHNYFAVSREKRPEIRDRARAILSI